MKFKNKTPVHSGPIFLYEFHSRKARQDLRLFGDDYARSLSDRTIAMHCMHSFCLINNREF